MPSRLRAAMSGTPAEPALRPRPVVTAVHAQDITEELAWALVDPFSDYRRGRIFQPYPLEEARRRMREAVASDWQDLGTMKLLEKPPGIQPPAGSQAWYDRLQYLWLLPHPARGWGGSERDEDPWLRVTHEFPVFRSPRFKYFHVELQQDNLHPLDLRQPAASAWFLDKVQIVLDLLQAEYAFCVDRYHGLDDPSLTDPRGRGWDLTYFGPLLVKDLGLEVLEQAPAEHVWTDHRGGAWVQLNNLPFVPLEDGAARQALVESLGLDRRFPQDAPRMEWPKRTSPAGESRSGDPGPQSFEWRKRPDGS